MWILRTVLLLVALPAIIVAASVNDGTASDATDPTLQLSTRSSVDMKIKERFVESSNIADLGRTRNDQDRIAIPGLPKIADLGFDFSSITRKASFWLWLQKGTSPNHVFNLLQSKVLKTTGTSLEKRPEILDWVF
ncbi:hypothetical protein L915_02346 [Phytophthora nicotianae]|uniref:RxLR effector protein n=1 Tax=Phytophthora nicotianae TaxID=4792 RepID=W2JQI8_PHYNI|nr:hypothetical protein L915_02346 [Phytophthora nicotianae]ETL48037.1 hypothetical protein L916_02306 [Phytophthora nicotianae]